MSDYYPSEADASVNLPLFDHGQTADETRADAFISAKPKQPSRTEMILAFLRERGQHGATRHEIADRFDWPLSSTCGPCLSLLRDGRCRDHGKRTSPYGSPAAVIVAVDGVPK